MKTVRLLLPLLAGMLLFTSCDAFRSLSTDSTTSLGKPYELILVCPQQAWDGAIGDSLRAIYQAPVPYINQQEPHYDVLRINPRGFTQAVTRHRNILRVEIDPTKNPSQTIATTQYDLYAAPQVIVTLTGPNSQNVLSYISEHKRELLHIFDMSERDRAVAYAARYNDKQINAVVNQTFGIQISAPKGYVLAKQESDFVWCRFEYPEASQGFCIYSYPYKGKGSLNEQSLLAARNKFVSRIPGPTQGSHMITSEEFPPELSAFKLEGRAWIEMRGFWDVKKDFMGGPFVSFTTIDTTTNRVITLDCYIFSPKLEKRNFLRGVEHLLYMVTFPNTPAQ